MSNQFMLLQQLAQGLKLLYVEDDIGIRETFGDILAMVFETVIVGGDGREGLDLFWGHRPDLVITDIYMPRMDGLTMAETMKRESPDLPIIVTSAYSQSDEFLRSIDIGIDSYIVKPFTKEKLMAALHRVLDALHLRKMLAHQQLLTAQAIENAADGIVVTDKENRIMLVNPSFCRMSGYTADDLIGQNPRIFKSGLHDGQFYKSMWEALQSGGRWEVEIINRRKDGSLITEWMTVVVVNAENGEALYHVATCRDISQRKEYEEKISYQAYHDILTGLPNRYSMYEAIDRRMAKKTDSGYDRFAFVLIDIDGFKSVNDTYGHHTGDRVLVMIAEILSQAVRGSDQVVRMGGDEFVLMIHDAGGRAALEEIASRIVAMIEGIGEVDGKPIAVSASMGIALYPDDAVTLDALSMAADRAMYAIKQSGKNGYRFAAEL